MEKKILKVGTFFSGIGSPEQALVNLNLDHEIEFACEIDKYARETYLKNFNPKKMYEDITSLKMKDLAYVDLLVFGFPCQAFSLAGRRGGFDDTRGTLFYDALRYLIKHKPRYFIAENVKGLVNHDNGKTFRTIIDCIAKTENYQFSMMPFDNLGYHIHYKVLNTKDFGIPQNRERIFIIGIREDQDNNFNFPAKTHLKLQLKDILEDNVDEKYFLSQRMVDGIYKSNFMERKPMDVNGICKTLKVGGDTPCFKDVRSGALRTWPRTNNPDKDREMGRSKRLEVRSDNVANSITTHECDSLVVTPKNTKNIRRLTCIESERLQGFPDNFTAGVSDTQRYKQLGNTITVNVLQSILNNLLLR